MSTAALEQRLPSWPTSDGWFACPQDGMHPRRDLRCQGCESSRRPAHAPMPMDACRSVVPRRAEARKRPGLLMQLHQQPQ
jgi:hypothetical protein